MKILSKAWEFWRSTYAHLQPFMVALLGAQLMGFAYARPGDAVFWWVATGLGVILLSFALDLTDQRGYAKGISAGTSKLIGALASTRDTTITIEHVIEHKNEQRELASGDK